MMARKLLLRMRKFTNEPSVMRILPSLFLALMLTMGYFFFFRAQAESPRGARVVVPKAPVVGASPHDPYKAAMDKAHLAASQMNAAKAEADGIR